MTAKYLPRFLVWVFTMLGAANGAWAGDSPQIAPQGDGTYSITVKATNKFTRNTEKLKAQAMEAATKFCAKEGKRLKVVSAAEDKALYLVGDYARVTLSFKALAADDPGFAAQVEAPGMPAAPAGPGNEVLYNDLLRLDDLHKRGILTDAEFAAEKKRTLAREK